MADVIQIRGDTAANWTSINPVLHQREKGIETDTGKEKTGDGVTAWNTLIYSSTPLSYTPVSGNTATWRTSLYPWVPIDKTSFVIEYTGDGIGLIPDNVAGQTYLQDAFATVDSWVATGGTASVSGGVLSMTYTGSSGKIERAFTSFSAKIIRAKVKANISGVINLYGTVGGVSDTLIATISVQAGVYAIIGSYVSGAVTALYFSITSPASGNVLYIDWVYVGSGVYDTLIKDRSGNGNNAINNAIRPVSGKYCKEMMFNGSTSYVHHTMSSIGTTGTFAVRFKRLLLSTSQALFSTISASNTNGFLGYFDSGDNTFRLRVAGSTAQNIVIGTANSTSDYYTSVIRVSGSSVVSMFNAGEDTTTALTVTPVVSTSSLTLGVLGTLLSLWFNGYISHFIYDARLWSSEEAKEWSVNPISIDSRI